MSMRSVYTFKVIDRNEPDLEYGLLRYVTSNRTWEFQKSDKISEDSWRAMGLFPAAGDSDYLAALLYQRAPLSWRMRNERSHRSKSSDLIEVIFDGGLQVASDPYKLIPAQA